MRYQGRVIAVGIVVLFNILRYFYYHVYLGMPFHWDFFVLTAIFLSVAWWGGIQYDRAEFFATIDPLTRAFNRRSAIQLFHTYVHQAKKQRHAIGVFVVDLDDFKQINDTYGHNRGDDVLRYVSTFLHTFTKKEGAVIRWGGDEFVVLIPHFTPDKERSLQQMIDKETLHHPLDEDFPLTMSCGKAIYPEDGEDFQELIQHADKQMYNQKVTVSVIKNT